MPREKMDEYSGLSYPMHRRSGGICDASVGKGHVSSRCGGSKWS